MLEELDCKETDRDSKPIRKPSQKPLMAYAAAADQGNQLTSAWNSDNCNRETECTGAKGERERMGTEML